jgi:hypothetical protein
VGTAAAPAFAATNPVDGRVIFSNSGGGCDIPSDITPASPKVGAVLFQYTGSSTSGTAQVYFVIKTVPGVIYQGHYASCAAVGSPFTTNSHGVGRMLFNMPAVPHNFGWFYFEGSDGSTLITKTLYLGGQ